MELHGVTLHKLQALFLAWLGREVEAGRSRPLTADYYRRRLGRVADRLPLRVRAGPAEGITQERVMRIGPSWHDVQALQRMYSWAAKHKPPLVAANPLRDMPKPEPGQRTRVLRRAELLRLLRLARPTTRAILLAIEQTLARPGEVRNLRWRELRYDYRAFTLVEYKGRRRRKDHKRVRHLLVSARLERLLRRLKRRGFQTGPDDYVFLNSRRGPWSKDVLALAVRRLRRRAGLGVGPAGDDVVAYTLRHTAATAATSAGVQDRRLADLLGHTNTRTTARYQHLDIEDLADALRQAQQRKRRA